MRTRRCSLAVSPSALHGPSTWLLSVESETIRPCHIVSISSPTFSVGGELFWGDDRLEDAIDCALHGTGHAVLVEAAAGV